MPLCIFWWLCITAGHWRFDLSRLKCNHRNIGGSTYQDRNVIIKFENVFVWVSYTQMYITRPSGGFVWMYHEFDCDFVLLFVQTIILIPPFRLPLGPALIFHCLPFPLSLLSQWSSFPLPLLSCFLRDLFFNCSVCFKYSAQFNVPPASLA